MKLVEDAGDYEAQAQLDNVVRLDIVTTLDIDPDQILQAAIGKLDHVIIIGYTKSDSGNPNANDEYFVSSIAAGDTAAWLLQRAIYKLMKLGDEEWHPGDDPNKMG